MTTTTHQDESWPRDAEPWSLSDLSLLEALATTRAIRRFRPDPVPDADLARILWFASRAPSGSNLQPFRFLVLRDDPDAAEARALLGRCFRERWEIDRTRHGYERADPASRAARMGAVMQRFVDQVERAPVIVLVAAEGEPGHTWIPTDGGSVYPAVQNLLLAARALGYGGIVSLWHRFVDDELRSALAIPDTALVLATIPLGRPEGRHGPVRRAPLSTLVYENRWGEAPAWAVDPPNTRFSGGMAHR